MNKDDDYKAGSGEGWIADGGHREARKFLLDGVHPDVHGRSRHLGHQSFEDGGEGGQVCHAGRHQLGDHCVRKLTLGGGHFLDRNLQNPDDKHCISWTIII